MPAQSTAPASDAAVELHSRLRRDLSHAPRMALLGNSCGSSVRTGDWTGLSSAGALTRKPLTQLGQGAVSQHRPRPGLCAGAFHRNSQDPVTGKASLENTHIYKILNAIKILKCIKYYMQ